MKFYNIMLFVFALNLSLGLINGFGFVPGTQVDKIDEGVQTEDKIKQSFEETKTIDQSDGLLGDLNFLVENVRLIISGVGLFIDAFVSAVMVKPMLNNLLCTYQSCGSAMRDVINVVWILVEMVYIVGIVQLVTGRNIRTME